MPVDITHPFSGQETLTCSVAMKYTDKQRERMQKLGLTEAQYEARLAAARARGAKRRAVDKADDKAPAGPGKETRPVGEPRPAVKPTSTSTGRLTDQEVFSLDTRAVGAEARNALIKKSGYTKEEWDAKIKRHIEVKKAERAARAVGTKPTAAFKPPAPKPYPKPATAARAKPPLAAPSAPRPSPSAAWTDSDKDSLRRRVTVKKSREEVLGALDHQGEIMGGRVMSNLGNVREHVHDHRDTLASYVHGAGLPNGLRISPASLKGGARWEAAYERDIQKGFASHKGQGISALDHTIAHEMGHFLDDIVLSSAGSKVKHDVWSEIADAFGLQRPALPNAHVLDRWVEKNKAILSKEVSQYGASDSGELLAEIWAEYTRGGASARPAIKRIGAMLERLAKEYH